MIFITIFCDKDQFSRLVVFLNLVHSSALDKLLLITNLNYIPMADNKKPIRLTKKILQELKNKGYQYVLIKGYSLSKKVDWIELNSFQLTPVKELPRDPAEKEIYAPLDSEIILEWAAAGAGSIEAYINAP